MIDIEGDTETTKNGKKKGYYSLFTSQKGPKNGVNIPKRAENRLFWNAGRYE